MTADATGAAADVTAEVTGATAEVTGATADVTAEVTGAAAERGRGRPVTGAPQRT